MPITSGNAFHPASRQSIADVAILYSANSPIKNPYADSLYKQIERDGSVGFKRGEHSIPLKLSPVPEVLNVLNAFRRTDPNDIDMMNKILFSDSVRRISAGSSGNTNIFLQSWLANHMWVCGWFLCALRLNKKYMLISRLHHQDDPSLAAHLFLEDIGGGTAGRDNGFYLNGHRHIAAFCCGRYGFRTASENCFLVDDLDGQEIFNFGEHPIPLNLTSAMSLFSGLGSFRFRTILIAGQQASTRITLKVDTKNKMVTSVSDDGKAVFSFYEATASALPTALFREAPSQSMLVECSKCKKIYTPDSINPDSEKIALSTLCYSCLPPWHKNNVPEEVCDYHTVKKDWIYKIRRKEEETLEIPFGLEIEMGFRQDPELSVTECIKKVSRITEDAYFERDGSLEAGGVEMISNPMTLDYYRDWFRDVGPVLRQTFVGAEDPIFREKITEGPMFYGIHVNVSRSIFNDDIGARVLHFIGRPLNRPFMHIIGGRADIYSTDMWRLGKPVTGSAYRDGSRLKSSKYVPLSFCKSDIAEFRLFQSTLSDQKLFSYLEFLHSLFRFVTASDVEKKSSYVRYIRWLMTPEIQAIEKYPNLVKELKHPTMPTLAYNLKPYEEPAKRVNSILTGSI
jgi:hypothetical protein